MTAMFDRHPKVSAAEAAEATEHYPRLSLDELLVGYDRTRHRSGWDDDAPVGRESL